VELRRRLTQLGPSTYSTSGNHRQLPGIVGNTSLYNINGKRLLFASPVYCFEIVNTFICILAIVSVLSREESLLTLASLDRIKTYFF